MTNATRYQCLSQGTGRCGGDQNKRAKCQYCGGAMYALSGSWGVFTWDEDDRYPPGAAHRVFIRKSAADKYADTHDRNNYVTRWIAT